MRKRAILMALAGMAVAQGAAAAPPEPTYGHRTPAAARAALNREQADSARRQLEENAASKQAFENAQAAREAQIEADQARYEAETARLATEHEAAMARWRDDVAACRGGDRTRCKQR